MKFQKQIIKSVFSILFLLNFVHAEENVENVQPEELILIPGPLKGKYKKEDLNEIYDESSIEIQCTGTTCNASSDNVLLEEGKVTISSPGTYILGGELDGQLNIAVAKEDIIHLVLRNATISSNFGPAIYGEKCKKVIITTEGENTISDSTNYPEDTTITTVITSDEVETDIIDEFDKEIENNVTEDKQSKPPNACIFMKSNLTLNGKGTLNVNANFDEGIRSKKNLKLISGKINVISKGNGIKAKESISIKDGDINVVAGKNAIKVTKDTDPEEGFIVIDGGRIVVKAANDGIHAETHLTINDGYINVSECYEVYIDVSNDGISGSKINSNRDPVGNEFDEQVYINIVGGKIVIRVDGEENDGLDSNGSIFIGGNAEIYVNAFYGATFGGMGGVDSDGFKSINNNATVLITGSGNFPLNGYGEEREDGIKGSTGMEELTVEDVLKIYPEKTLEKAQLIVELSKEIRERGIKFILDNPETCHYYQPYLRVVVDEIQLTGVPLSIKDNKGNVIVEQNPTTQYGVIFYSSPEIVEGETYTITAGKFTYSVIAKVETK
ncbi:hypothetical protein BCR32DRAFT_295505 [Anaeromyces robustus]|uniref:Carbohydrate-binding domain-containing protein n=1 Tax=Anaeromyces robustus TaxID=1754192 RepID=A0A1Y1WVS7_9FUNG|nr:hypothetical protein BCR32DRAFT_295505 [Anaeromyces robustus]|eukprot:ORX77640.1 hypothetical protein BCR32DRAFT_295505 [Anaeromyces robustus]